MKTLDLRPRPVRLMSRLWGRAPAIRGDLDSPPEPLNILARGMNRITDGFMARRVAGRRLDTGGPAIVSVGNLALGGTGKTPVVAALAGDLAAAGWRGAVLTRGFGSPLSGPLEVDPKNVLAGDEARLMASVLTPHQWPVFQARRRNRGLESLLALHPDTDIVIVEDGHQTAGLGRHLDIVILDAWTTGGPADDPRLHPVTGAVFPFGPWRESSRGADRAGIWLLETTHPVPAGGANGQAVACFSRHLSLREAEDGSPAGQLGLRPAVLSGIARPEAFEISVRGILAHEPVLAVRHGDHAAYGPREVDRIMAAMQEAKADFLVTTAKDWVKLEPFWSRGPRALVADLEIRWGPGPSLPQRVEDFLGGSPRG